MDSFIGITSNAALVLTEVREVPEQYLASPKNCWHML
jgi:hypothetical protein